MEWQDYVTNLLSQKTQFDNIAMSFSDNSQKAVGIPPLIKASILILDLMYKHQGKLNILVFPERIQSIFIFTLTKLLYNIADGRIGMAYSPETFLPGERLRFLGSTCQFISIEERDGKKCIWLQFTDMRYSAPIAILPLFQKTTATRNSSYRQFENDYRSIKEQMLKINHSDNYLTLLQDYKTHMDKSIVNMTSIMNTKKLISNCSLGGQKLERLILTGQADYDGAVRNIGAGQLGGTPAIVLAYDLYSITRLAERGHSIQSIIIDISNANVIQSQLDALDALIRIRIPITCLTDTVNSFHLQPLLEKNFNLWRWDKTNLTNKLYNINNGVSDIKIKNCLYHKINYITINGNEICIAIAKFSLYRNLALPSLNMLKIINDLYPLIFTALRQTVYFSEEQCYTANKKLDIAKKILSEEKDYISSDMFNDFTTIIMSLKNIFNEKYILPKHDILAHELTENNFTDICIVVPNRTNKEYVRSYWQEWCYSSKLKTKIYVLYQSEYLQEFNQNFTLTIITGWLKSVIMQKILYNYNNARYIVLLYDYENRWKCFNVAKWESALGCTQNEVTLKKSLCSKDLIVSLNSYKTSISNNIDTYETDEYNEIEISMHENKYKEYINRYGYSPTNELTEAIPVNFIGGYLAFYRTGHKVITATDIIMNDAHIIKTVLAKELQLGDFVVVREADRDLIKEIADVILEHSNKSGMREMATKWKEVLAIETISNTDEEIYNRLQKAGCARSFQTVHSWIHDEDCIAPQNKQDLELISAITEGGIMEDLLNKIYEAAETVRSAHLRAGHSLSVQLRNRIVQELEKFGEIDSFNIWNPIEMQIDGIGLVRILKVIDIGDPLEVDMANTNNLIAED